MDSYDGNDDDVNDDNKKLRDRNSKSLTKITSSRVLFVSSIIHFLLLSLSSSLAMIPSLLSINRNNYHHNGNSDGNSDTNNSDQNYYNYFYYTEMKKEIEGSNVLLSPLFAVIVITVTTTVYTAKLYHHWEILSSNGNYNDDIMLPILFPIYNH